MISYHTVPVEDQPTSVPLFQPRKSRSVLATVMLTICIITFVLQTELAQYVQKTTNYSKPYFIFILMLHDRLVAAKVGAVMLCMAGVLAMACWPQSELNDGQDILLQDRVIGKDWIGIAVASIGAALYGFYEVYYKKYASPSQPTILFANTITGIIGIVTFLLLWIPFPLLHFSGVETFELPDLSTFGYILAIASMSVIYNATFMAVIALVNPVFAAVGVMLTVPAVAITDVLVTGVMVPISTIVGSVLILFGFYILNKQVENEEKIDQDLSLEGQ
ncbi:hypothetical protein INT46_010355 [Mucor plumbeus]|uniref:EamA domain-containing protein n=1 Tax=Mucor plumbeus TaxID=97098 RepID=A0A8H7RB02_9FUNG|nr:hypothetical protein INT46_010355 [Mucor plumbeus]